MNRLMKMMMIAAITIFTSCREEEKLLTKEQIKAKADSIIGTRLEELNKQSMEDLDKRQSIEVKTKADSIVEAYLKTQDSITMQ